MADIHQIRYYFEHNFLPHIYYDPKIILPLEIRKNPEVIHQNWQHLLERNQAQDIYPEDAWTVQGFELDPHTACNVILCPDPQKEPQCFCIFLLFTYDFRKRYYFTMEKGGLFQSGPFLCGWDPNGKHRMFGECGQDREKALDQAIQFFRTMPETIMAPLSPE